jgi:hypothetical protein
MAHAIQHILDSIMEHFWPVLCTFALGIVNFFLNPWPGENDILAELDNNDSNDVNEDKTLRWARAKQNELEYVWKDVSRSALFAESMYLTNMQGMFLAALAAAALSWFDDMNEGRFARGAFGAAIALAVVTVYQSNKQLRTLNRILLHPNAPKMIMNQLGSHNTLSPPVFYPSIFKRTIWQSAVVLHNVAFIAVAVGTVGTIYPEFLDNEKQRGVSLEHLISDRNHSCTWMS